MISYAVCFQYMDLYEVGLKTVFICFLIDEEVNLNKSFEDENGKLVIHPKTGQPIGKMRASHRLYTLIGHSKPKIQASERSLRHMTSTSRRHTKHGNMPWSGSQTDLDKTKAMLQGSIELVA